VSLGPSARDTFIVPIARSRVLFEREDESAWALRLDAAREGRVARDGRPPIDLQEIAESGAAVRGATTLPLGDQARGRVVIDDITVLFQVLPALPSVPRPRLPPSLRGSITGNLDWALIAVVGVSLIAHTGLATWLRLVDWPRRPDIVVVPDRRVTWSMAAIQMASIPPPPRSEPAPAPPPEPVAPPRPVADRYRPSVHRPSSPHTRPAPRPPAAPTRQALAAQVRKYGNLAVLARPGEAGAVRDLLGHGRPGDDADKTFAKLGGVKVATTSTGPTAIRGSDAPVTGRPITGIPTLMPGVVETGDRGERDAPPGTLEWSPPIDPSDPELAIRVRDELHRRKSAFIHCYERALRHNPSLAGRLELYMEVSPAGIVRARIENDHLGDVDLSRCLRTVASNIRFASLSKEPFEVGFPFIFAPAVR
jgi:hypothetical protein